MNEAFAQKEKVAVPPPAPTKTYTKEEEAAFLQELQKKKAAKQATYDEIEGLWQKEKDEEEAFRKDQEEFIKTHPPVINKAKDRVLALLNDTPARFEIVPDTGLNNQNTREKIINAAKNDTLALQTIEEHNATIERMSAKYGVDPDLVRAVAWTENARGNYFGLNDLADKVGVSGSQGPMNINGVMWSTIIGKKPGPLDNSQDNIEASVLVLKRIRDRIQNPTAAKIGSIWNFAGNEKTNAVGEAIGHAYEEKPWTKKK